MEPLKDAKEHSKENDVESEDNFARRRHQELVIQALNDEKQNLSTDLRLKENRIQELQLVINWKDDEYKKIQHTLKEQLVSDKETQEKRYNQLLESSNSKISDLENQVRVHQQTILRQANHLKQKF